MKKLCIIAAAYPPNVKGGGEKSTQLLAKGLSALGNEVTVLTIDHRDNEFQDDTVRVRTILSPNVYWNFKHSEPAFRKLIWHFRENFNPRAKQIIVEELERIKPEAVITSTIENFGNAAWEACHELNIPVAHILRSYYTLCFKGTMFRDGHNCEQRCHSCRAATFGRVRSAAKVNGLIGISDFILNRHEPYFTQALSQRIFNPVEVETSVNALPEGEQYIFGYLGRIEPEKGVELLLEAFQTLPDDYQIKIAGTGKEDYVKYLRDKYPSERIHFLGWVSPEEVYRSVHFVVVPSMWHEPFGRTVIEAYSHGVPVIASARGGLKELVEEGVTGQLFEPDDPANFRQACQAAVKNQLASRAVSLSVQKYAQRFSVDVISAQYDAFIDAMLNEHATQNIMQAS
ncbi:glycosyltransferase family 4 protein [Methylophaga sp.]|uniref:glycosyltransferase family 4 protein n=1 Tax=Methylophaga sp. TaxID=2024840 RepID=UPI0013FE855F|nr:glycosyltransferase family 4 protein [Methylophaga sp.]MTI62582.1 glycosyltransferase [Methylophaga sp.]